MAYRLTGRSTEFCSCSTPCPCAFGQVPDDRQCNGIDLFDVQEGQMDGTSLAGTRFAFVLTFAPGPWTVGNWTLGCILDANATSDQREALRAILSGDAGGDMAALAGLIADMRGFFEAPFDVNWTENEVSFRAGDLAEGSGSILRNTEGTAAIEVQNPNYPFPSLHAGRSTKVRAVLPGLAFDVPGTGMWTGPIDFKG